MQYNKNPISLREGHAFIDGVEVLDSVKMTVNFTPETWTGRQLGEKTPSTLVIQGIMDDTNSDFYAAHGSDVLTCVGCVMTGDLPLTALDAESSGVVDDAIAFNIKDII